MLLPLFNALTTTHLNDTVDGQVDNDVDDEEDEYGCGYAHIVVQGTDANTTVLLIDYTKHKLKSSSTAAK